jgi:hypothetical protein
VVARFLAALMVAGAAPTRVDAYQTACDPSKANDAAYAVERSLLAKG